MSPTVSPMRFGSRLAAESLEHRLGEVDAVHAHAARPERERDPPGADAELERGALARERGEELDRGRDDLGPGHRGRVRVVARCDLLVEADSGHASPCQRARSLRSGSRGASASSQRRPRIMVGRERGSKAGQLGRRA